ncbi:hypothetical protein BCR35DRAFT_353210 [Leucosporidium creatinivorum]|uniref:Rho-GAP domain-containing protein n=1 Tax=Leucosporidium creatinivorum TaxID=106004 RepID=A0A1Y2F047_9BASI|nr:hypothetical protein BCR35DRAFT_353210 [Leucosporidium creatinivorum]
MAAEAQLPLYLSRGPSNDDDNSSSPPLDDDERESSRQSFPATVRESYASTWTTATSKRESLRGPPPPLPPKPTSWTIGIQPPPLQRGKSTSDLDALAAQRADDEPQQEVVLPAEDKGSPAQEQGSPSQWLDIMFGHSEGQHAPSLSRSTSTGASNPFPSAPRIPPRPTPPPPTRLESPAPNSSSQRAPSPQIQLTASPSLPNLTPSPPPPPLPARPLPPPTRQPSSSLPPPSSTASATSALNTLNQSIQHLKLKDRFAAGVGFGREWGGKGRNKVQEGWRVGQAAVSAAGGGGRPGSAGGSAERTTLGTSPTEDSAFGVAAGGRARSTSPLPSTILGHRIPRNAPQLAFGLPLPSVVESTRVREEGGAVHRKRDDDPVTGDEARRWLPSVALRCLQYLEEWGRTEEGVYRVPGRSNLVTQLRALFTSGIDLDLREIHPGDLDPHAVASLFKSWLREIPESLLSPALEGKVEEMCMKELGYSASVSQFLGQGGGQRASGGAAPGGGGGAATTGMVDGRAPRAFLEELRKVFAEEMEAEYFYLLRALSYHLARLASHSGTNKMTLSNLRLILSPTLRLSPVFLQILVEEREIIFGKTNESARSRESSESNPPRSPVLVGAGARGSPSSLSSSTSGFPLTPSLHSTSAPPTPSSSDFPPRATRTPIADRFVSTFAPPAPVAGGSPGGRSSNGSAGGSEFATSIDSPPLSAGLSPMTAHFPGSTSPKLGGGGGPPVPPPKPFIPSRTTAAQACTTGAGGGFFGNRSPVLGGNSSAFGGGGAAAAGTRKASVTSLTDGGESTTASKKDPTPSQSQPQSASTPTTRPAYPPRSSSANSLNTRRGAVGGNSLGGGIDALSSRRGAVTPVEFESEGLRGLGVVVGGGEEGGKERLRERRGSVEERQGQRDRQWSDDTDSASGSLGATAGAGRHQIPRKPVPRRASLGDQSSSSIRASLESSRPSVESTRSFASSTSSSAPAPRAPIALPSLELPAGLGLGLGVGSLEAGKAGENGEDGWGLLSVEERRRFFGG